MKNISILVSAILCFTACNYGKNNTSANKTVPVDSIKRIINLSNGDVPVDSTKLEITFIGNEAFEISDGRVTLLFTESKMKREILTALHGC